MKKQRVFLYFIPQRNEFNICKVRKVEGGVKDVFVLQKSFWKIQQPKLTHTVVFFVKNIRFFCLNLIEKWNNKILLWIYDFVNYVVQSRRKSRNDNSKQKYCKNKFNIHIRILSKFSCRSKSSKTTQLYYIVKFICYTNYSWRKPS